MAWITITDFFYPSGWADPAKGEERARSCCRQLEEGRILLFLRVPFELPASDTEFLLSFRQRDSRYHKNISYRPSRERLSGFAASSREEIERLRGIMRDYSRQVTGFLSRFLSPYAARASVDFASFRPLEEKGRDLPVHKRNDLLHTDAFPTRPTGGGRILRVFTNIHPSRPRVWITTETFGVLARRFSGKVGLGAILGRSSSRVGGALRCGKRLLAAAGFPVLDRCPYDVFMLRFHDFLKENAAFQQSCAKTRLAFPPGATWLVFTDGLPHAVLSGQFALEQTYIVPPEALLSPSSAPLAQLERLAGSSLSDSHRRRPLKEY